ncbi:MAG: hypothetical protein E6Z15_29080, partial [Paenibacillus macerans]|nr:hypothetical protein [Paenibacillus macerans]
APGSCGSEHALTGRGSFRRFVRVKDGEEGGGAAALPAAQAMLKFGPSLGQHGPHRAPVRAACGLGRCAPGALAKDCTAAPSEAEWNRAQSASAAKSCRGAFLVSVHRC